jgi:hypothetical protein
MSNSVRLPLRSGLHINRSAILMIGTTDRSAMAAMGVVRVPIGAGEGRRIVFSRERSLTRKDAIRGFLAHGLWVLCLYLLATLLGIDFIAWYINNAPIIGLSAAFIALAWDLDRFPDLISAWPQRYRDAWVALVTRQSMTLMLLIDRGFQRTAELGGAAFKESVAKVDLESTRLRRTLRWPIILSMIISELLPRLVYVLVLFVSIFAAVAVLWLWFLVICPVQYFAFLVFGLLPRLAVMSESTLYLRSEDDLYDLSPPKLVPRQAPANDEVERGEEVGFILKPVTFTSVLSTLALWGLSMLLD